MSATSVAYLQAVSEFNKPNYPSYRNSVSPGLWCMMADPCLTYVFYCVSIHCFSTNGPSYAHNICQEYFLNFVIDTKQTQTHNVVHCTTDVFATQATGGSSLC